MLDDFYTDCVFLDKKTVSDGMGGTTTTYETGAAFRCGISMNNSLEAKVAEMDGVTSVYNIVAPDTVSFDYHDIIKRISDSAIFRVTSSVNRAPNPAQTKIIQVTAEEWSLV